VTVEAGLAFVKDDGGRAHAGFKGRTGDCSTRAIAIALGLPYTEVYDALNALGKTCRITKRHPKQCYARTGVCVKVLQRYLASKGWTWHATMGIGTGTTVHLRAGELPKNASFIARISKHLVAIVDGEIHDTGDPSMDGTRAVYGIWYPRSEHLKFRPSVTSEA
jgi:hypothetical protein